MKSKKLLFAKTRKKFIPKGKFPTKLIEEIYGELLKPTSPNNRWKGLDWTPKHHVWTEDGIQYSSWQIGPIYTGDA